MGWLEDDPVLLGWPMFRGYVSFKERNMFFQNISVYVQRQCLQTQKHKPYHLL